MDSERAMFEVEVEFNQLTKLDLFELWVELKSRSDPLSFTKRS